MQNNKAEPPIREDAEHYFYAMLHRMRYIKRWSLMRNSESEDLQQHSLEVAYWAHAFALIRRDILRIKPDVSPDLCVQLALYHDVAEIMTGDLPTPVKYYNENLHQSFLNLEDASLELMLTGMPEPLRQEYMRYLRPDRTDPEVALAYQIMKAADTFSAYLKCLDEKHQGNYEFKDAEAATRQKLEKIQLPELHWFLDHCLEPFHFTLDELRQGGA